MGITAREVMDTDFYTVRPETTIAEAVKTFIQASEHRHQKVFGLMVTGVSPKLTGKRADYMESFVSINPKRL